MSAQEDFSEFKLIPIQVFDSFSICIPSFFREQTEEEIGAMFPSALANNMWLACSEQRDAFLQISGLDDIPPKTKIQELLKQVGGQIGYLTPGFQLLGSGTKAIRGITIACMEYKSHAVTGENHSIVFIFPAKNKFYVGNLTASSEHQKESTQLFFLMMDSLVIKDD